MEYKSLIELIEKPQSGEWGTDDETGTGIPVIRTTNFTDKGIINYSNIVTRNIPKEKIEKKSLRKGDIIIEKSGGSDTKPVGRVVFFDGEENTFLFNNFTGILRVKSSIELLPKYLFYFLFNFYWCKGTVKFENKTTGLHNLKLDQMLNSVSVPIIDTSEQLRIIDALDKARTIISLREKQIESLDELIKARFVEMFGDPNLAYPKENWQRIVDIGNVVGGSTPKTENEDFWDGEYRWLTPAEIVSGSGYIYDSVRKITKAGAESCSLQEMPIGTVILSSRAPIGKVALAGNTFYCNQGFKNIICNDKINPVYLYSLLLFNTDYLNSLGRGATFKEISKSIVENIKIPVPKIELQNQFADFVAQIDKSKVVVQKALDEAQLLFDSLMQKYFG